MESERRKLDEIDSKIMDLLKERLKIAKGIGEEKKKEGKPIRDRSREEDVKKKWIKLATERGIRAELIEEMAETVMRMALEEEKRKGTIGFLGPEGTFTHEAALEYFGEGNEVSALPSIPSVFSAVETGLVDYGVVPCENMLEGSVNLTLDALISSPAKIYAELFIPISHSLIIKPETKLGSVKVIMSHPQALAQCRDYIEKNFPEAELRQTLSTAKAVQMLDDVPNSAAIGTAIASRLYKKRIAAKNIQDMEGNSTRFFVLAKHDHARTGKDKTSIIFSCKDEPGALFTILHEFAGRKINLSKIESRPSKTKSWEYLFFVDFDGHNQDLNCKMALSTITSKTTLLKILGSYPRARE
jgi:chorismate mutase/prephenate dehydratase